MSRKAETLLRLEKKIAEAIKEKPSDIRASGESYTSDKIRSLHSFIDNYERETTIQAASYNMSALTSNKGNSNGNGELPIIGGISEADFVNTYSEAKQKMASMKVEIEEANKTIETLKIMLEKERARAKEVETELTTRETRRLEEQKLEFEGTIERQLHFVDQLVKDKKDLAMQCETLLEQLRVIEGRYQKEINDVKEKFKAEMKSAKDVWSAGEKARREKWIQEKTQEIKDMTIRGLEPEVERIMKKQKEEIKKVEEKHQKEMEQQRLDLLADYEVKLAAAKEKISKDNEGVLSKERDFISTRMKDHCEVLQNQFEEDKKRLKTGYDNELEVLEKKRKEDLDKYHEKLKTLQENQFQELQTIRENYEKKMSELTSGVSKEKGDLLSNVTMEKETWMRTTRESMEAEYNKRIEDLKAKLTKERDKKLEEIVNKLAEESTKVQDESYLKQVEKYKALEEQHTFEVKRLRREIQALEGQLEAERETKRAFGQNVEEITKKVVNEKENVETKQREIDRLKGDIVMLKKEIAGLKDGEESAENIWRKKATEEKRELDKKIFDLEARILQLRKEAEAERYDLEEKHANQLEDVESRVKKLISKKEADIKALREELSIKENMCSKYEMLLEKQRKDLMNK